MLAAESIVAVRGVSVVLRRVSFTVAAGDALVISGPNGSGKSTLLRILAGLVMPTQGRVTWNQSAIDDLPAHSMRVGYLGQLDAIKPVLRVREHLPPDHMNVEALAALDLARLADMPARFLSAGQRRRLGLARVVATKAPVWLLDEPTVGLDFDAIDRLAVVLARHRQSGGMIIASTHVTLPLAHTAALQL